jgi:hypothetical protein
LELRASVIFLASPIGGRAGDRDWSLPKSLLPTHCSSRQHRTEATILHSLPAEISCSSFSQSVAHLLPIPFHHPSSRPTCRGLASASHSHSERPSPAHDKQSSAAIKAPPPTQLLRALPRSRRVSSSEYGQARLGSKRFISGMWPNAAQRRIRCVWSSSVECKCLAVANAACPVFRAPVMKWGVVLAGASDFVRPADKLSLTQNLALMATGSIWTRWCFVIRPKNML